MSSPLALYTFLAGALTASPALWLVMARGWNGLVSWLLAVNVVTVLFYGFDKLIAGTRLLRVPEWTLHLLALAGGSPGALVAQKFFRHKTLKGSFRRVFWLLVVLQSVLIAFALTRV